MLAQKSNTQALFHFLLSELIVECSEHIKNHDEQSVDSKLREIGSSIGFRLYPHIAIKRGIHERQISLLQMFKQIKTKVFKHLFNYQLPPDVNSYQTEEKKTVIYGIVDEIAIYLAWMPENCQIAASGLVAGIIEGVLVSNDLKCKVTPRKVETEKEDKNCVE